MEEIQQTVADYKQASQNAKDADFDSVEVHAEKGMLILRFLSLAIIKRMDGYGWILENHAQIVFDILESWL